MFRPLAALLVTLSVLFWLALIVNASVWVLVGIAVAFVAFVLEDWGLFSRR
jgi:hypothetical protein